MSRPLRILLAVIGPVCVGALRFLLPYYTAPDSTSSARAVAAHLGQESAVLWLGLAATLTLAPGLYAVRDTLPTGRLRTWALGLVLIGYLSLPVVLVGDMVLWTGVQQGLDPARTGALLDGLHPAYGAGLGVFVVAHVLGTVLLGVLCLRGGVLPTALAWALTISQPLHFVTTVFLGLPWLDLIAWGLTAVAMGWLAAGAEPTQRPGLQRLSDRVGTVSRGA
ncbi:MAG: hypothetical protein ABIN79_06155 [Marmoricola sp.]